MNPILLALALSASPTKLGVFVAGDDATSKTLLAACPAVAVFRLPDDSAAQTQIATLRQACPQSTVVLQVGGSGAALGSLNLPTSDWSSTWLLQVTAAVGAASGDWVEGPTEITVPVTLTGAQQLASYWNEFAWAVAGSGYRPVVGGLAPGVPAAVTLSDGGTENLFCQTLRTMASFSTTSPWAWSQHALAPSLDLSSTSPTLVYRTIAQQCAAAGGPVNTTIFLTEAGRTTGAWQASDLTWLAWFDAQLQQDGVAGAALYESGATDRSLAPIATQLAAYLQNPSTPDGGTPDGGSDAGQSGGVASPGGSVPSGPPGDYKSGCASTGAGFALVALLPPLVLARRRRGQGVNR